MTMAMSTTCRIAFAVGAFASFGGPALAAIVPVSLDFEGVTPGIYASLEIDGFRLTAASGVSSRNLQIVNLNSIQSGYGLSKAITVADISESSYNKSWGITIQRVTTGEHFGITSFDVEGWESPEGQVQQSVYSSGFCDENTCTAGKTATDLLLGYQSIPMGISTPLLLTASLGSGGGPFYTGPGSDGYVFFDNIQLTISQIAPVPEPSTALLIAPMLASLASFRAAGRRRTIN
jgi:hypothetical protein